MSKFATEKIDIVKGKIDFYKLRIDDICEFDDFCYNLEQLGNQKDIGSIFATMQSVSNLNLLPKTRFRELKGRKKNDKIKDYEIKTGGYRVYLFKSEAGKIIVFGGLKDNQDKDIGKLRRIKLEYIKKSKHDN